MFASDTLPSSPYPSNNSPSNPENLPPNPAHFPKQIPPKSSIKILENPYHKPQNAEISLISRIHLMPPYVLTAKLISLYSNGNGSDFSPLSQRYYHDDGVKKVGDNEKSSAEI